MTDRVKACRAVDDSGQQGRLIERQLVEGFVEIIERGRSGSIGALAEINLVEIELENLVLGEGALDTTRQHHFLHLAFQSLRRRQQEVFGHLLGNRRGPLEAFTQNDMTDIGKGRTDNTAEIQSAMLVKILVLGRNEGLDQALGNVFDGHEHTMLAGILGDQATIAGMDTAHHRRLVFRQLLVVGEICGDAHHIDSGDDDANQRRTQRGDPAPHGGPQHITQCENLHYALKAPHSPVSRLHHDIRAAL